MCITLSNGIQFNTNKLAIVTFLVQSAVEIVSRAKKPLILLGSQATLPPVAASDVKKSLEVNI